MSADARDLPRYQILVNGQWRPAASNRCFETWDPYTAQPWALVPECDARDVAAAADAAESAFTSLPWTRATPADRGQWLRRLADLVERDALRLARVETRDNGKLLAESAAQVKYLARALRFFAGVAETSDGAVLPSDKPDILNLTLREPIGPVAAIVPWNSPLQLLSWKLAPALAAGCTLVIKPSEHASVSTLEFARLVCEAGFPDGVVNVVTGFGQPVGEALVRHPAIRKVAFTGGDEAGRRIYAAAAQGLKPVSLELGGKSPNIVFADADRDQALNGVLAGIFGASGQSCVAGSRLLLHDSIHDEFVERLVAATRHIRAGDPTDPDTQFGPIATRAHVERVLACIARARAEGATCLVGGDRLDPAPGTGGQFVAPTVFVGVRSDMAIAQEEIFGPVLAVMRFRSDDEAVAIANNSRFGLAAGIWTANLQRALHVMRALKSGTVWVNTYRAVSYLSPFGGYKDSGFGRDNGREAIDGYLQTKSVWMSSAAGAGSPFVIR